MKLRSTKLFDKKLEKIARENPNLAIEIRDVVKLMMANPNHQGLRIHKLKNDLREMWSASVKEDLRIIFMYSDSELVLVDIGTHREVYFTN